MHPGSIIFRLSCYLLYSEKGIIRLKRIYQLLHRSVIIGISRAAGGRHTGYRRIHRCLNRNNRQRVKQCREVITFAFLVQGNGPQI